MNGNLKEEAKKAAFLNRKQREERIISIRDKAFENLKQRFPELEKEPGYTCILAGYQFRPYPTGVYSDTSESSYSLDPIDRLGWWVYDMASLGEYILWREERDNKKDEKVKRGNYLIEFLNRIFK